MNALHEYYLKTVVPQLKKDLGKPNLLALPRLEKVVVNIGITGETNQKQALENMAQQLGAITGQKPKTTSARKSIAGFKLRAGDPVGLTVTLRGERMYQFVQKLILIVLPRVKDFQGISAKAFDQKGNYSLGLEEQIIFPEIEYDKIDKVRGMQINFVTNAQNQEEGRKLLQLLGLPFKKENSR